MAACERTSCGLCATCRVLIDLVGDLQKSSLQLQVCGASLLLSSSTTLTTIERNPPPSLSLVGRSLSPFQLEARSASVTLRNSTTTTPECTIELFLIHSCGEKRGEPMGPFVDRASGVIGFGECYSCPRQLDFLLLFVYVNRYVCSPFHLSKAHQLDMRLYNGQTRTWVNVTTD